MASPVELDAMRRAIVVSAFGLGTTSPNPPVGCVILDSKNQIVGEGYHERKGEPHAETQALAAAGERACGGTAVVTLEPCNHHGLTPPCHQALIDAGIARAIISVIDPTSRGKGGAAALRKAGLDVEVDVLAGETRLVIGPWLTAFEQQRPFVTLCYSVRADGRFSGVLSEGRTSFRETVVDAHNLRLIHDAVLLDDGRLEEGSPGAHGRGVFSLPVVRPPLEVNELSASLLASGVRSLLLDGACSLTGSFVAAGWVDQAIAYVESSGPSSAKQAMAHSNLPFGLVPGFALRNVTRIGRTVRVCHESAVIQSATVRMTNACHS